MRITEDKSIKFDAFLNRFQKPNEQAFLEKYEFAKNIKVLDEVENSHFNHSHQERP
ncbi:MAG: hypothetical protein ACI9K1_001063 [Arcticibacterium sp.]|jgi:hypothetical protein